MAFVRIAFFAAVCADDFAVLERELAAAPRPVDRHVFAAGPVEGGWQVVQIWESKSGLDAFNAAHLVPAMQRLADSPFTQRPEITDFDTTSFDVRGSVGY